jgi:hypothetical protein|tara:strand:- start:851 stop:1069 length:219 start_codon:yes stop_codon:yes gene_type:complete
MIKIGDLVKYGPEMTGLQNCLGIVVGIDGGAVEVRWMDVHVNATLATRTRNNEISLELPDFLMVASSVKSWQ